MDTLLLPNGSTLDGGLVYADDIVCVQEGYRFHRRSAVRGAFDAVRRSLLSPQRLHLSSRFPNNCLLSAFISSEQSFFVDITALHTDLQSRAEREPAAGQDDIRATTGRERA